MAKSIYETGYHILLILRGELYYEQVLGRDKFFCEIPELKHPVLLPKVTSEEKILDGLLALQNLKYRTILPLVDSAGLRVSEAVSIKITNIQQRLDANISGRCKREKSPVSNLKQHHIGIAKGVLQNL